MEKSKIAIVGAVSALIGGGFGYGFAPADTIMVEKEVEKFVEVPVEVPIEKIVEVPVVKEVNVTKEVLVDNGKLDDVLQHIYDNDGSIQYIIDDLDDDEVQLIADRVILVNEFKKLAVDAVEKELFDELDGEVVGSETLDEDDMERLRIDDDLDEIVIDTVDFDDEDAVVIITGTFEQDDIKYEYTVDVVFKDGEFDELENITVVEK